MSENVSTFWVLNTGFSDRIQFNGILYVLRENRGKRNKGLILDDVKWGASTDVSTLVGLPIKYNHGKDQRFGHMAIGEITSARILNTGVIFLECFIYGEKDGKIPKQLLDTLRSEIKQGVISMLSMFWEGPVIGTTETGKPIWDPARREFGEVSICQKGYYKEARIVSFAASADAANPATPSEQQNMAEAQSTQQQTQAPPATPAQQTPSNSATTPAAAPAAQPEKQQGWKFDGFKNYGFKTEASNLLTKLLEEVPEEERTRITGSEGAFSTWTSDALEKVSADFVKYSAAEKASNARKIAEQQKFVEEFSPIAQDLFGEEHESIMLRLKEKASKVDPDIDIYRKFAEKIVRPAGIAAKRDVTQTTDRAAHAASAPESGQSKRTTFHLPTPEPPAATDEHKRLLRIMTDAMYS